MSAPIDLDWEWDPFVLVPLALSAGLYARGVWLMWRRAGVGRGVARWQAAAFAAAWLTLVGALVSPLHEFGEHLFVAHMVEHELLMVVAAPLFAVSRPMGMFLHALPRGARVELVNVAAWRPFRSAWAWVLAPVTATVLHGAAIWIWHAPSLLDATLENETLHRFQHIAFLGTGLIFWWAIVRAPRRTYGIGAFHVFATMLHTSLLGALLTLAPRVFYPLQTADAARFGLQPIEDQQLAGLFMWIPGGAVYLMAGLVLAGLWLTQSRRHVPTAP